MTVTPVKEKEKIASTASLDEAMDVAGCGLYNIGNMLFSGLILMGMIMETLILSYVIPAAQCDLQLSSSQKGWLAAIPFIAIILTSHFWGWVADTRGRRLTMLFSMATSLVFSILSSFAPNLGSFAALQFVACIFISGPASGVVYTYLGEFNCLRYRDKMVAFGASFVGIGTVALPAVAWVILPWDFALPISFLNIIYRPWRLFIIVCTIPYALASLIMIWSPESPKYLYANKEYDECLKVLRKMYAVNKRVDEDDFPIKSLREEPQTTIPSGKNAAVAILTSMRDQTFPLFKHPLLPWTCLACFVQFGIFSTANGFYVWFPTILNALANHEGTETRICDILGSRSVNSTMHICDDSVNTDTFFRAIIIGLVFCSTYIIVGFLVDCVGKKWILVVVLGGAGICGMISHLVPNQQVGVVMFGIFQMSGACIGLLTAVVVGLYPTKLRAMAVCLSLMMGRVGSVMASNLIGFLLDENCSLSFYLYGGLLVVCSLLCLTLPGNQSNKKDKQFTTEPVQTETHEPV